MTPSIIYILESDALGVILTVRLVTSVNEVELVLDVVVVTVVCACAILPKPVALAAVTASSAIPPVAICVLLIYPPMV